MCCAISLGFSFRGCVSHRLGILWLTETPSITLRSAECAKETLNETQRRGLKFTARLQNRSRSIKEIIELQIFCIQQQWFNCTWRITYLGLHKRLFGTIEAVRAEVKRKTRLRNATENWKRANSQERGKDHHEK